MTDLTTKYISYVGYTAKRLYYMVGYAALAHKGITLDDLYQQGHLTLLLLLTDRDLGNCTHPDAYVSKILYRRLKLYIDQSERIDVLPREHNYPSYTLDENGHDVERLTEALTTLDDRRHYVLACLYGLEGSDIKSKAQIGRELGVSYQMVQSLHKSSLRKLNKII